MVMYRFFGIYHFRKSAPIPEEDDMRTQSVCGFFLTWVGSYKNHCFGINVHTSYFKLDSIPTTQFTRNNSVAMTVHYIDKSRTQTTKQEMMHRNYINQYHRKAGPTRNISTKCLSWLSST